MDMLIIDELSIIGVYDRGIANKERIVLRPTIKLNLGYYALVLGIKAGEGYARPINDHFLWLGSCGLAPIEIAPPSWLFIYTGPGEFNEATNGYTKEKAYVMHWGKDTTILADDSIVPVLICINSVAVGETPPMPVYDLSLLS